MGSPRADVTAAEVRAVVAVVMASSEEPQYAHYQLMAKVADLLHVSKASGDLIERRAWSRFCGQVERALRKLADEGKLAKGPGAHGTLFYTLEQHAAMQARRAQIEAASQARQAERDRVYDELSLLGICVQSERGQEIRLDFPAWCLIVAALDTTSAGRNPQ